MKRFLITSIFAGLIGFSVIVSVKPEPDNAPISAQATATPTLAPIEIKTVRPQAITDYLANPGIGWQEAHTFGSPLLPETVAYRRSEYNWAQQNPSEGNYNFAPIDADLAAARSQGKQFSFRVYSMRGGGLGGNQIPQWVFDKGATLISSEPDYSNCTYQEEWGRFVNALRERYDGSPGVAFIDISGYGNFNEWSWTDAQTNIEEGSLDSQARRRLADAFIGGSGTISCKDRNNQIQSVNYSYPGFARTQLIMPYAGIQQSSRYVNSKKADVGFRHDCLGRAGALENIQSKLSDVIQRIWPRAPIVFEFCGSPSTTGDLITRADSLLRFAHGSLAHDNFSGGRDRDALANILRNAGYRYLVKEASLPSAANPAASISINMTWANVGYAPNYPKMGQSFTIHTYLIDPAGNIAVDEPASENPPWLPGEHIVNQALNLPANLAAGTYQVKVAIIDRRTARPINLAFEGRDDNGRYLLDTINIISNVLGTASPQPTPSSSPTASPIAEATPTTQPTPTATARQATPGQIAQGGVIIGSASTATSACLSLTANPASGAAPLTVSFNGSGFETGKSISMYEFDFGDASGGQLRVVRQASSAATHKYNNAGTYTAKLRVQTSGGEWKGSANCEKTITVAIPSASQTPAPTVAGSATQLPETGPREDILTVITIGIAGFLLQKKFRLIH